MEYNLNFFGVQVQPSQQIKLITDFDEHTKISEINSLDNLVWLCPNHHAMLEKGLIKLE